MGVNLDKINALYDDIENGRGSGAGKVPVYELQKGLNRFRIIPPPEGMDVPWVESYVSFGVGPNEKTVVLRRPLGLEPDPVSDYLDKLAKSKNKADQKTLKRIAGKRRFKMFVVDRNNESAGALLFDTNMMVMKQILKYYRDPEYGDLSDPKEGHDLKIEYTPKEETKNGFPNWELAPSPKTSPLRGKGMSDDDYELLVGINYFEEFKIGYPSTVEYMEAVLEGSAEEFRGNRVCRPDGSALPAFGEKDDSDDEDTPPAKTSRKSAVVEDDEDASDTTESGDDTDSEDTSEDEQDEDEAVAAAVAKAQASKPKSGMSVADQIRAKLKGGKK